MFKVLTSSKLNLIKIDDRLTYDKPIYLFYKISRLELFTLLGSKN